jgi:hypothetical protein
MEFQIKKIKFFIKLIYFYFFNFKEYFLIDLASLFGILRHFNNYLNECEIN